MSNENNQVSKTAIECLERNGFDFAAFEYENEYSARNILLGMDEFASHPRPATQVEGVDVGIHVNIANFKKELIEWENDFPHGYPFDTIEINRQISDLLQKYFAPYTSRPAADT